MSRSRTCTSSSRAAKKLGGKVVLGGHSLGGSVVTAYATWDFGGHAGADELAGLVYIDGGSTTTPVSAQAATQTLQALDAPSASPWLAFGGIAAPYAGLFEATGAAAALLDPNAASLGQTSGLLPADIVPSVPRHQSGPVRVRAQCVDITVQFARCSGAPRPGHRLTRTDSRLERLGSSHTDRPLRNDVFGRGESRTPTAPSGISLSA